MILDCNRVGDKQQECVAVAERPEDSEKAKGSHYEPLQHAAGPTDEHYVQMENLKNALCWA